MEQARRLIRAGKEQQEMLEWQVVEARQKLASLKMVLTTSKEIQARTESNWQTRLVSCHSQLSSAQATLQPQASSHTAGVTGQVSTCTQFSNLFCLSGQLAQMCKGGAGQQVGGGQAGGGAAAEEESGQGRAQPATGPDQAPGQHQL